MLGLPQGCQPLVEPLARTQGQPLPSAAQQGALWGGLGLGWD